MTLVRNPFDAGGYSLAEMTQAINILPNLYTRLGQIGLFRFEGVSQRSVIIEQYEGVLNLLPSVPLGGPSTVGTREGRSMRSFALPWIPHDDVILPNDIQGQPALGVFDGADPLVEVMNRKLQLMRRKHAQTREYMEMNALRGIVKDGAGNHLRPHAAPLGPLLCNALSAMHGGQPAGPVGLNPETEIDAPKIRDAACNRRITSLTNTALPKPSDVVSCRSLNPCANFNRKTSRIRRMFNRPVDMLLLPLSRRGIYPRFADQTGLRSCEIATHH
jgi:hypothetical protein